MYIKVCRKKGRELIKRAMILLNVDEEKNTPPPKKGNKTQIKKYLKKVLKVNLNATIILC